MATHSGKRGYFDGPNRECCCSPIDVQRYLSRISGPLLDRIDIHVEVPAVQYRDIASNGPGEPSETIRERVQTAHQFQRSRFERPAQNPLQLPHVRPVDQTLLPAR